MRVRFPARNYQQERSVSLALEVVWRGTVSLLVRSFPSVTNAILLKDANKSLEQKNTMEKEKMRHFLHAQR